jgi:hypothetical protein
VARDLMARDFVWQGRDTSPGEIEAALRSMLSEVHASNASYIPARVLNLVCVVEKEWSGEIANRLRQVGRFHPSRTVVCSHEQGRTTLDAVATISIPEDTSPGTFAVAKELVVIECGPRHLSTSTGWSTRSS